MELKRIILLFAAGCVAFGSISCKKEEEEETKDYLYGAIHFTVPTFVSAGDVITMTPDGARHPDGGTLGYYWEISELDIKDTVRLEKDPATIPASYNFVVPDTLIKFTIKCAAFAEGYYELSSTEYTTAIHPERSIRGYDWTKAAGKFTDPRDNKVYPYTKIDTLDWFCKNLAYEGLGIQYDYSKNTSDVLGNFYTWDEALKACPEGWRLSSENDWLSIARTYGNESDFQKYQPFKGIAGKVMGGMRFNEENELLWEFWPAVKVTNDNYLCLLPFGYGSAGHYKGFAFTGFRNFAAFWTSDEYNSEQAVYRYIYEDKDIIYSTTGFKEDFLASVRCVRKAE